MPRLAPPGRTFGNCLPGSWKFHEVPSHTGATCLDGSPYGFYFMEGTPTKREPRSMKFNESWLLLFEGGGWCFSPEDCALRADSKLGSSREWKRTDDGLSIGGLVNRCCFCTKFCRFRRVYLKSCDGHSFAGNATIPAPGGVSLPLQRSITTPMRSAGRAILSAVIGELVTHYGLGDAVSVLVGGCSAGGLAALLNAERIRDELHARGVQPRRFKVASLAGIFGHFRDHRVGGGLTPFEEQMRAAVELGRISLPARCTQYLPPKEHWRCVMGRAPLDALPEDLPAYVYQSRLDLWQTNCVLSAGRSRFFGLNCSHGPVWRRCLGWMQPLTSKSHCTPDLWAALREYEEANDAELMRSVALQRAGYATFIHSCYDHCPSPYGLINTGALLLPNLVNDSINVRESIFNWMLDEGALPAWNHTHVGCMNALVASHVVGKQQPAWCRKPECGQPDKMHHDDTDSRRALIRRLGWQFGW